MSEEAKRLIKEISEYLGLKIATGASVNKYEADGVLSALHRIANPIPPVVEK